MSTTNQLRLMWLKIVASLASLLAGGCNLPTSIVLPKPQPVTPALPTEHKLTVEVVGGANVNVSGGADVNVKATSQPNQPSVATQCDCGCNHASTADCEPTCPRRAMSRPSSPSNSTAQRSAPQFVTQYSNRIVCENGVCRTIREAVQVPLASGRPPTVQAGAPGRIRVYLQPNYLTANGGNNASLAMRLAIGERKDIEWLYGQPPAVNGRATWPTAVKPDGSVWASGDWTQDRLSEFERWRAVE